MEAKRMYRSNIDRKVAGVCGGLGEYLNIDPLLIRLIFVVLTLAGGGGVLIYIVMWIIMPESPVYFPPSPSPDYSGSEPVNNAEQGNNDPVNQPVSPSPPTKQNRRERKRGSLIGGLVLITIGGLFLADELIPQIDFGDLWPLILVAIGVGLLINAFGKKENSKNI